MKRANAIVNALIGAAVIVFVAAYALGVGVAPEASVENPARAPEIDVDRAVAGGVTSIRAAVIGASGGLMSSSGYSASITIGEPLVGNLLTSASYRACIGFECTRFVPRGAYLPLLQRNYTAEAICDSFDPNANRRFIATGLITSNQTYAAKICEGDLEDNYRVQTGSSGALTINISLPVALRNHTTYFVYSTSNYSAPISGCTGAGAAISSGAFVGVCPVQPAGGYVVRLYTDSPTVFDNVNSYTFSITYSP